MKKIISILLTLTMLVGLGACTPTQAGETSMDFSLKDGMKVQNLKKFDNFTSTWPWVGVEPGTVDNVSLSQVPALADIKAESLRFDLFMGFSGLGSQIGKGGKDGTSDAEYKQARALIDKLLASEVNPYLSYFASPEFTQINPTWKATPDAEKWELLCHNIADYFKRNNIRLSGHEIWNEPDFGTAFFTGTWVDYINTYIAGAKGIKSADPEALVGGMAAAYIFDRVNKKTTVEGDGQKSDFQRFIERSSAAKVLPEFISWHYYGREGQISGRPDEGENFDSYLMPIRNALNQFQKGTDMDTSYPELETTQQHVNEFNIYQPSTDPIYRTTEMPKLMFQTIDRLLEATDITRVAWASLLGEKVDTLSYDLIDSLSLQRYPAYHSLWMYSRLPIDRVKQDLTISDVGSMAGVDSSRAGVVLYNKGKTVKNFKLNLKNIPFATGDLTAYIVDDDHISYTTKNAPLIQFSRKNISMENVSVNISLKPNATIYVELNDSTGLSEAEVTRDMGRIIRKDYFYPERGDGMPYSEFYENGCIAHVGMAGNTLGTSAMAVTLDNLLDVAKLKVDYSCWGDVAKTSTSALGFKVDYKTTSGYTKSVFYTVKDLNKDVMLPFGTKTAADKVISLGDTLSGSYELPLTLEAPADWTGNVVISYLIQDAGLGTTAKFIMNKMN